ncbi:sensor histidine kinase [Consotaella salsifontis]|uniref:sensor histidine kinase n=1 Tax=Consotaella salsifontis TaxID=1365950 RepID=UPI001A96AA6C|nr:PAS domain-containing protein [Consotaella salsifontis]
MSERSEGAAANGARASDESCHKAIGDAALRESESRFRHLADAMPQLVWTALGDGTVDYYNCRFQEYSGIDQLPDGSFIWAPVVHPDDLEKTVAAWSTAVTTGEEYFCEHRVQRGDGSWRWHVSRAVPQKGEDGAVVRWFGTATDIHPVKMAEDELRQEQEQLRIALDVAKLGNWSWDQRSRLLQLSPRSREIFGLSPSCVASWATQRSLILPEDLATVSQAIADPSAEGRELRFECRIRRPSGSQARISVRGLLQRDQSDQLVEGSGIVRDITEDAQVEAQRSLLLHELNHRVKNTLAVVQGISSQTFRGNVDTETARREFERRIAALSRAHDLLTASNWNATNLSEIIADQIGVYHTSDRLDIDGRDMKIRPKIAVSLALALHELFTNATKYGALSNETGRVSVRWSVDQEKRTFVLIWQESRGPVVAPPSKRGFGSRLIERALAGELGGRAEMEFREDGLRCTIAAPASALAPPPLEGEG